MLVFNLIDIATLLHVRRKNTKSWFISANFLHFLKIKSNDKWFLAFFPYSRFRPKDVFVAVLTRPHRHAGHHTRLGGARRAHNPATATTVVTTQELKADGTDVTPQKLVSSHSKGPMFYFINDLICFGVFFILYLCMP